MAEGKLGDTADSLPPLPSSAPTSVNDGSGGGRQRLQWRALGLPSSAKFVAVLGAQWGDEGKGKLVDFLAEGADLCCRFNGGANAGHTLVVDGVSYAMHLLPCGVLSPNTLNILGNGTVIHLPSLQNELDGLEKTRPGASRRLFVSERAHLLFDIHQRVDGLLEKLKERSGTQLGTTGRGIGPAYTSKAARHGLRVADLRRWEVFERKYRRHIQELQQMYNIDYSGEIETELQFIRGFNQRLQPLVVDAVSLVHNAWAEGKTILAEGANAAMLDVDFGSYPFVTSSTTCGGGICTGLGVPPRAVDYTIGVVKAYLTRVGEGPFPSELFDAAGEHLLKKGSEFGTTTSRPRRCGWIDIPMIRYTSALNGFDAINLTKLDVLSGLKTVKICCNYRRKEVAADGSIADGAVLPPLSYPPTVEELEAVVCDFEELEGWEEDTSSLSSFDDLPAAAKRYISRLQELLRIPILWVGVGPGRENTLSLSGCQVCSSEVVGAASASPHNSSSSSSKC